MGRTIIAYLFGVTCAGFWLSAGHFLLAGQILRPSMPDVLGYGVLFAVVIAAACLVPVVGAKLLWGDCYSKSQHKMLFGSGLGALWSVVIDVVFWAEPTVLFVGYLISYTTAGALGAAVFVYIKGEMKPAY